MRRTAALLALVLLTAGCTDGERPLRDSRPDGWGVLAEPLGACHQGETPDPPADLVAALSGPGVWYRVDRLSRGRGEPQRVEVKQYGGRYLRLGGDPHVVARAPQDAGFLLMENTTAAAIERAIEAGGTVTVKTGAGGDPRRVAYAVAERGDAFFVGECAYPELTVPGRGRFGVHLSRYVSGLYGKTSAAARQLLAVPWDQLDFFLADPEHRVLTDLSAPQSLLDQLGRAWLTVSAPASWDGAARLCGALDLGRGPCVALRGAGTSAKRFELWYDKANPTVSIVLHGPRQPGPRLALLAVVDLSARARRAGFDHERDGIAVHVALAERPSLAAVLRDPGLARDAVAEVRVAPCAVGRCNA